MIEPEMKILEEWAMPEVRTIDWGEGEDKSLLDKMRAERLDRMRARGTRIQRKPKEEPTTKVTKIDGCYGNEDKIDVIQKCAERNIPVLLMWETGTGKTTIIRAIAESQKKQLVRLNMNGQTWREEFVGKYTLVWGNTIWQDWPLIDAMKKWYWLLVDELNVALPEILFVMQSLLEANNGKLWQLLLSEKDWEIVTPHDDFRIFATANPASWDYVGTKDLNAATLSRFVVIEVDIISSSEERKLLKNRFPALDDIEIFSLINLATNLRDSHRKWTINYFCSTRDLVNVCNLLDAWVDKINSIKCCIYDKVIGSSSKMKVWKIIDDTLKISYWQNKKLMNEVEKMNEIIVENDKLRDDISQMKVQINELETKNKVNDDKVKSYDELKSKLDSMMSIYTSKIV